MPTRLSLRLSLAVCVGFFVSASLFASSLGSDVVGYRHDGSVQMLLRPVPHDATGLEAVRVENVVGRTRVRRICASGRCEALLGDERGYHYHLSYPADRALSVNAEGLPVAERPVASRYLSGRAAVLLLFLTTMVGLALASIGWKLASLQGAFPAWVDADGRVTVFVRGEARSVSARSDLLHGPATAHASAGGCDGYRDDAREVFHVEEGAVALRAARLAYHRGIVAVCFLWLLSVGGFCFVLPLL